MPIKPPAASVTPASSQARSEPLDPGAAQAKRAEDAALTADQAITQTFWASTAGTFTAAAAEKAGGAAANIAGAAFQPQNLRLATAAIDKLSIGLTGLKEGLFSPNGTATGKLAHGVLAAGASDVVFKAAGQLGPGLKVVGSAGNAVMLADLVADTFGDKVFGEKIHSAAGGYVWGHTVVTPARVLGAYLDSATSGDSAGIDAFAQDARDGKLGVVYQAAVEAGAYWAEHGIKEGVAGAARSLREGGVGSVAGFAKDRWQACREFFGTP